MLARAAIDGGFVPGARPVLAIAADGSLGAVLEPTRIGIVELSGGVAFAEIGVDPAAEGTEIGWVSNPPRLLVVSRFAAHSSIHLIDPHGPRTVAEIRMESAIRLYATVGNHALVVGPVGAAILATGETTVTPYQFPSRMPPRAAGASGSLFTVAVSGAIEEWDPQARMPRRRFRLPNAATITALGGSDRVLWMTTQHDPSRIDVVPLVNRGQPKLHDLPEPIASVSGHPRSDLLACVGGTTGRLYLVDLDGRAPMRTIVAPGIDRIEAASLVVGRGTAMVAAQTGRAIAIVSVERDSAPELPPPPPASRPVIEVPRSTLMEDTEEETQALEPTPIQPRIPAPLPPPPPSPRPVTAPLIERPPPRAPTQPPSNVPVDAKPSLSERMSGWRTRGKPPVAVEQPPPPAIELGATWRDDVVAWTRAGTGAPPASTEVDELVARFGLSPSYVAPIVLAYGTHLLGERGVAPVDIARVLGGRWAEALGTGELAARGVMHHEGSRVHLADAIRRLLDGLPPGTGTLVGTPGAVAVLGPCAIVAPLDAELHALALTLVPRAASAILVAHASSTAGELAVEARARRAVPLVRSDALLFALDEPAILVVTHAKIAEQLGIPTL